MGKGSISRRKFLRGAGAAGLGALAVGTGSAGAEQPERNIVGATTDAATEAAKRKADSVYRVIDLGPYPTAVAGVFPEEALDQLERRSDVEYVEPDVEHEIVGEVLPWGIDRTDADVAHANGETGGDNSDGEGGADIAIIDTGIDDDHPDLNDNLATPLDDTSNHKAFVSCRGGNCNTATIRGRTTTITARTCPAPRTPRPTPRESSGSILPRRSMPRRCVTRLASVAPRTSRMPSDGLPTTAMTSPT